MSEFDYTALLRPNLPPAAARWGGFPRYNFVGGHNDEDSVPVEGLVAAAAAVLRREGRTLAMYGLHSGPLGYRPLREFIAAKVARDAGIRCTPDDILITSGSLQGLDLVNQLLLSPGDTVLVEEMTYGGAITRIRRLGAEPLGVPVDAAGLDPAALRRTLIKLRDRGVRPKYIYTIPTVQNPTATVMPLERRRAILALAHEFHVPVFEDECYADLVWSGQRPAAIRSLDDSGAVIHIGSFSKSIAPALRLGYLIADWSVMSRILAIKSDGGSGALEQMILAEYCTAGFEPHVRKLRQTLKAKVDVLVESLQASFGDAAEFDYPDGGIFLWVKLPAGVDTSRLEQLASRAGVAVNPGAEWTTDAGTGRSRIRICFAHASAETLREGVTLLAEVCHREFGVPARDPRSHR